MDRVETVEKGHGRVEIRRLECSESLASYLSQWTGLRQVCRIERRRSLRGKDSIEVVHAITAGVPTKVAGVSQTTDEEEA